jgi:hypothetical protein
MADESTSRARSAGRRFASTAAQTGLAAGGGLVYYGAHALVSPSLYGTDAMNIPKRCWILPIAGVVGGALLTMAPKIASVGLGVVGGAVAIGAEQIQMGISINKNKANQPQAAAGTSGVGSLLEPGDLHAGRQLASGVGEVEAGALYQPPDHRRLVREAAGLST